MASHEAGLSICCFDAAISDVQAAVCSAWRGHACHWRRRVDESAIADVSPASESGIRQLDDVYVPQDRRAWAQVASPLAQDYSEVLSLFSAVRISSQ